MIHFSQTQKAVPYVIVKLQYMAEALAWTPNIIKKVIISQYDISGVLIATAYVATPG